MYPTNADDLLLYQQGPKGDPGDVSTEQLAAAVGDLEDAIALKLDASAVDVDAALTANSDTRVASQKAVKSYVAAYIAAQDVMVFKGIINCSTSPNYPAADTGYQYRVSVAGKIGGPAGPNVEGGDILVCLTDDTAAGTHADVGSHWGIIQTNIDGAVTTAQTDVITNAMLKQMATGTLKGNVTGATAAPADIPISTFVGVYGQCKLVKDGSNIVLKPRGGNLLTINGVPCVVPDAGVSLAATGLTAGTTYYIYATQTDGVVTALDPSGVAHATSTTAGNKGVEIKSGDDTRSLVGFARVATGPAWSDTKASRLVRSWFNRNALQTEAAFTVSRSTTSTALAEINGEIRLEALLWADEVWQLSYSGASYNSTTSSTTTGIAFDVTNAAAAIGYHASGTNVSESAAVAATFVGAEGYHYATVVGRVGAASTGNWEKSSTSSATLSGSIR